MRRCRAFTLVELLVVIGIIGVLVSLLLPAMTGVRRSAQLVNCQSNLRDIGNSLAMYCNDNKDYLPPRANQYLSYQLSLDAFSGTETNNVLSGMGTLIRDRYALDARIFYCPALPADDRAHFNGQLGYGDNFPRINNSLNNGIWMNYYYMRIYRRLNDVTKATLAQMNAYADSGNELRKPIKRMKVPTEDALMCDWYGGIGVTSHVKGWNTLRRDWSVRLVRGKPEDYVRDLAAHGPTTEDAYWYLMSGDKLPWLP